VSVREVLLGDLMFTVQHSLDLASRGFGMRFKCEGRRNTGTYIHSSGTASVCPSVVSCWGSQVSTDKLSDS